MDLELDDGTEYFNHLDLILAPETPSRLKSGGKSVRKSDGVNIVGESPEVKTEAVRRSPRRLQAALALRRRASFYTSMNTVEGPSAGAGSSRHFARAESQVWSEKAKATTVAMTTDDNGPKPGHSAQFLFSKILSRNESDSTTFAEPTLFKLSTPTKSNAAVTAAAAQELLVEVSQMASLSTPSKVSKSAQFLSVPGALVDSAAVLGLGTATPMKTPRQVKFDLTFQPATPSTNTKTARSILKSPVGANSPRTMKTPLKTPSKLADERKCVVRVLDETSFSDKHQLDLSSPCKSQDKNIFGDIEQLSPDPTSLPSSPVAEHQNDIVHKLDESSLSVGDEVQLQTSPAKATGKSTVSPLILRRSTRNSLLPTGNFFQRNPNWTVVDYRSSATEKGECRSGRFPAATETMEHGRAPDPYEFDEAENSTGASQRPSLFSDTSSHKRKLFQVAAERTTPVAKKRKVLQQQAASPRLDPTIGEPTIRTPPPMKFQPPSGSSLFMLENSPLVNSVKRN